MPIMFSINRSSHPHCTSVSLFDKSTGATGRVVIDSTGDRIYKYVVWTFSPGNDSFYTYLEIDPTKTQNEASGLIEQ